MWSERNSSCFAINTCRICATNSEVLIPIFGTVDDLKERIDYKIAKYLPIVVRKNDSKPKYICFSCISKLEVCRELHGLSRASDFKFNNMLFSAALLTKADAPSENMSTIEAGKNNDLTVPSKRDQAESGPLISLDSAFPEPLSPSDPVSAQDLVFMVELKYKDGDQNTVTKAHAVSYSVPPASQNGLPQLALSPSDVPTTKSTQPALPFHDPKSYATLTYTTSKQTARPGGLETVGDAHKRDETARVGGEVEKPPMLLFSPETQSLDLRLDFEADADGRQGGNEGAGKTEQTFPCSVCGKIYRRRANLGAHMGTHTQVRPHVCTQCGASFVLRWDLTLHQRLHTAAFTCAYCGKPFSVPSKLQRHVRVHTGERPFTCSQCGKSFGDKRNLAGHERTHSNERPFTCSVCGRSFRVAAHLKDHSRVHSKVAAFTCDVCGKRFKWKTNLNLHLKVHAGSRHPCEDCGREFLRRSDLRKHKRTHGSADGSAHSCSVCLRSYADRAGLSKHKAASSCHAAQDKPAQDKGVSHETAPQDAASRDAAVLASGDKQA